MMKKYMVLLWGLLIMATTGCSAEERGVTENSPNEDFQLVEVEDLSAGLTGLNVTQQTAITVPDGDVVEITEKLFIAQTNDIYLNTEDYMDKTIKYQGFFSSTYWEPDDITYYWVIRNGPGCCGNDGTAGFEVMWDGEWPEENDWCEVTGTLEYYDVDGWEYLRLSLTSLTVLEERGQEFVAT